MIKSSVWKTEHMKHTVGLLQDTLAHHFLLPGGPMGPCLPSRPICPGRPGIPGDPATPGLPSFPGGPGLPGDATISTGICIRDM